MFERLCKLVLVFDRDDGKGCPVILDNPLLVPKALLFKNQVLNPVDKKLIFGNSGSGLNTPSTQTQF
jgi:hypothetical protein